MAILSYLITRSRKTILHIFPQFFALPGRFAPLAKLAVCSQFSVTLPWGMETGGLFAHILGAYAKISGRVR